MIITEWVILGAFGTTILGSYAYSWINGIYVNQTIENLQKKVDMIDPNVKDAVEINID